MFLVVDVGNSHTVTGVYQDDKLTAKWRLKSDNKATADELAIQYTSLFQMAGIAMQELQGAIIASVVPTLETAWLHCCRSYLTRHLEKDPLVVTVENLSGLVQVKLPNPSEVGADRLVNALAAWDACPCDQVVIDFGTAITFDCITRKCEYIGGTILPGIAISLEALAQKTAKLPHIDVGSPPGGGVIGKSTIHAMKSGILYGYGAMIDGLVDAIRQEMLNDPQDQFRVLATGGMATIVAPYAKAITETDPMLTLKGLEIIYRRLTGKS